MLCPLVLSELCTTLERPERWEERLEERMTRPPSALCIKHDTAAGPEIAVCVCVCVCVCVYVCV